MRDGQSDLEEGMYAGKRKEEKNGRRVDARLYRTLVG